MANAPAIVTTLGGITFNPVPDAADLNGAYWNCDEIDGWDSPGMRQKLLDATGRHGKVAGQQLYDARALVLAGDCVTPSVAAFWASKTRLTTATNLLAATGALVVNEPTPKLAAVMRAGRVRMREYPDAAGFHFEVPLLAPDPRKYAATASSAGMPATVTNAGDIETFPTLIVFGPSTNPMQITNGGKTVRLNVALTGGQTLLVNFATGLVTISGVNRYDIVDLAVTRWWSLAPGANVVTYSGGGTSPTLHWSNAWI